MLPLTIDPRAVSVPPHFTHRITEVYGAEGAAWLVRLPSIVAACAGRWALTVGTPFVPLSHNWVAPAVTVDGAPAVLKVGYPSAGLFAEIEVLRLFDGHGIARLLAWDRHLGALLLERLAPGTALTTVEDDARATTIAAGVMRRLWRPAPAAHSFPTVARWAAGFERLRAHFDGGTGPLPPALVADAEERFADLLASSAAPALLHGDLHHDNILAAPGGRWLAIDPKGLVGEPAYETGAFLRNPRDRLLSLPDPAATLARRIAIFADDLDLDRRRIRDWAVAQAVLSAWWSVEDHGHGWEFAITCADLLAGIDL